MTRAKPTPPQRVKLPSGVVVEFPAATYTPEMVQAYVAWLTRAKEPTKR